MKLHFKSICLVLAILLCQIPLLMAQKVPANQWIEFSNRWKTNEEIHIKNGKLESAATKKSDSSSKWKLVPVAGTKFYRIVNKLKTNYRIHIENGKLEATKIKDGAWSAMWTIEPVPGTDYIRIVNRWKSTSKIHREKGPLECSPIKDGAWSAMWKINKVGASQPTPTSNSSEKHPLASADAILDLSSSNNSHWREKPADKVHFFKGDKVWRYDMKRKQLDPDFPKKISNHWAGLSNYRDADFSKDLDAAVNYDNNYIYFFKGEHYIKWDIQNHKVLSGYPAKISKGWKNLPSDFKKEIDAAYSNYNGEILFFKGDQHIKYNVKTSKTLAGYPKKSAQTYKYASTSFGKEVKAAFRLKSTSKVYFWDNKGKYFRYDTNTKKAFNKKYPLAVTNAMWNFELRKSATGVVQIKARIKCVEENDGGGDAEEIFGTIKVDYKQKYKAAGWKLFSKAEDAHVEINEGDTYYISETALVSGKDDEILVLSGTLYEEDTGGDDKLGTERKEISIKDLLAKSQTLRFTHDDTKIDVTFEAVRPKGKYVTLKEVKCIVPSAGTDTATEAAVGIGIGITSLVAGLGVGLVNPTAGGVILEIGLKSALASGEWVDMYVQNHPGQDDLLITKDGRRIWPRDEYTAIKSQQSKQINKTWKFDTSSNYNLVEYDSASRNDNMGGWKFTEKALGEHTLHIHHDDEKSTYEVVFVVKEYK